MNGLNTRSRAIVRILACRRCAAPGPEPGCTFCDACRPQRLSDACLTDVDLRRMAELGQA